MRSHHNDLITRCVVSLGVLTGVLWVVAYDPAVAAARQDTGDDDETEMRTIFVWRTAPLSAVLSHAFKALGLSSTEARNHAGFALTMMNLPPGKGFTDHPKYATCNGVEMLTDALRAVGVDVAVAPALAAVVASDIGIDVEYDAAELNELRERVAEQRDLTALPLDGEHASAFLERIEEGFTAVGYLDREADAFIDTLRDRWNLRGGEARRPSEPVLDWRRSNLHLVLTDAFVLAAGHSRADARQLACNAMLQLNMGIDRESFDRHGESVEAHPAIALFKHDPRGLTNRRIYVTYGDKPIPADLHFQIGMDDLAADVKLDERTAQPVLKSVLDLPGRTVIWW